MTPSEQRVYNCRTCPFYLEKVMMCNHEEGGGRELNMFADLPLPDFCPLAVKPHLVFLDGKAKAKFIDKKKYYMHAEDVK